MRRVLLTVHKFFPEHRAGTEVLTLKVAQELKRRGYEVLVLTAAPPDVDARHKVGKLVDDYEYEGIRVKAIGEPMRLDGYTFAHEHYHPRIKEFFETVLNEFRPEFLHVFHAQNLSGGIIEAARQRHLPVVLSTTDFWFVCPIVQLKRPDGSVCRGPGPGAIKCLTCYTPRLFPPASEFAEAIAEKYPATKELARGPIGAALFEAYKLSKLPSAVSATLKRAPYLKDVANTTQAIMVPTKLMRDIFVENGINQKLLHHVPFGIDTEPLTPFQQKQTSATLRIGFIGTLFEHKGVDLLIEAFQALPAGVDAVLKIYGDPNQFAEYGQKLKELASRPLPNSEKIEFCGTFANSQLGAVLQNLDVLVVPSRWYENTPLVIQSALATKTPLIGTDLGGLSELIKPEQNGLLFELNNAASLSAQLLRLITDRALLKRLTDNIAPERTVAQMVDDIERIYESVSPSPTGDVQLQKGGMAKASAAGT
jgi:glycosyltransferase involved in cell wall biosynthesis